MRLVLYTGKGGVGKTTTAAAAAVHAADRGLRTLVASADAAHSLGDVLEERLGAEVQQLRPNLQALEIDARVESARHWGRVQEFLSRSFVHHGIEAAVAEELAALPGAEELTTLLAVEEIAQRGDLDLLVLDCAPSDAALRLVTLPDVARGLVRTALQLFSVFAGAATPLAQRLLDAPLPGSEVFQEAEALLFRKLTALHTRLTGRDTSARLVVTPEQMVIDEARRTYSELALFEVACDAVVVNRVFPAEALQEEFFREWGPLQAERLDQVKEAFAPLPVLCAPLREEEVTGHARLLEHGRALFGSTDPQAMLCPREWVRFDKDREGYWVRVPLPGARSADLDVAVVEDELVISTAARRRALKLPRRFARLPLQSARLEASTLHVCFGARTPASQPAERD